jgi:hypothetical protein
MPGPSLLITGAAGQSRVDPACCLTHDDLVRLVVATVGAPPDLRLGIFHGLSANRTQDLIERDLTHCWSDLSSRTSTERTV